MKDVMKLMVLKRLAESLPPEKVEQNIKALNSVADKIMNDLAQLLLDTDSKAPMQKPIKPMGD